MSKKANHYIDTEEFSAEMDIHAKECREARSVGKPMPKCPESIGHKFLLIAENLATKGNFARYTWKDEMISDAIECMLRYRYNYVREKGHAFSYFTTFARFAFISRIKLETKETHKKAKYVQRLALHDFIPHVLNDEDSSEDYRNNYVEYLIEYYDQKLQDKEKKKVKKEKKDA
jgi:hypothetical protein